MLRFLPFNLHKRKNFCRSLTAVILLFALCLKANGASCGKKDPTQLAGNEENFISYLSELYQKTVINDHGLKQISEIRDPNGLTNLARQIVTGSFADVHAETLANLSRELGNFEVVRSWAQSFLKEKAGSSKQRSRVAR